MCVCILSSNIFGVNQREQLLQQIVIYLGLEHFASNPPPQRSLSMHLVLQ